MRFSRRIRRLGFTFLELVVVILITGIIAAIAVPRFSESVTRYRVESLAWRIVADLETVRQTARAASAAKTFTVDTSSHAYTLGGVTHPDHAMTPYTVYLEEYVPMAHFGTVNLGGDTGIGFNGFGYPDSGGTIEIVIGSQAVTISVDPQTGQATIL